MLHDTWLRFSTLGYARAFRHPRNCLRVDKVRPRQGLQRECVRGMDLENVIYNHVGRVPAVFLAYLRNINNDGATQPCMWSVITTKSRLSTFSATRKTSCCMWLDVSRSPRDNEELHPRIAADLIGQSRCRTRTPLPRRDERAIRFRELRILRLLRHRARVAHHHRGDGRARRCGESLPDIASLLACESPQAGLRPQLCSVGSISLAARSS